MNDVISTFIFFFAVIDPIGTVPVFLSVTRGYTPSEKRSTALRAVIYSCLILLFFIIAGEPILNAINIPLPAFQIAGGIVLFLFALGMIFGESKPEEEIRSAKMIKQSAVFPLAIPSIASPGAMLAAVLLTENDLHSIREQIESSLIMIFVLIIVFILLMLASQVQKLIGDSGASIISRVMGLILTAVAVSNIIEGIKLSFGLNT